MLLICLSLEASAQQNDLAYYYNKGQDAYRRKVYPEFYDMMREAHRIHPFHQGILYQLGMAAALTGHREEALTCLRKAIQIDASFRLAGLSDFRALENAPEFRALLDLQKEYQQPVIHSDTAFVLRDRSLHTEGIAFDPATNLFYLGSIHKRKIIRVTAAGEVSDFCEEGFEGMTSIFGIKADSRRNVLWACSSPMAEMENYDSSARSAVFKFDLASGRLIEKIARPAWEKNEVFGDLVVSEKGDAYVSESQTNTIFRVNETTHQLEPFFTSPDFLNVQGLAFSEQDEYLFIADYIKGIYRLNMKTKALNEVTSVPDVSFKGIDGLSYFRKQLIIIQNGVVPARVLVCRLDGARRKISEVRTLDRKHPAFNEPTMGVMSGDTFFYIANSQWQGYDRDHHIKPDDQLQDIVILKSKIRD